MVGYAIYFLQKHQQKPSANGALNSSNGQRPPPPPSYPPPSLPNSSAHKASPFRPTAVPATTTSNGHHHYGAGSPSDQSQQHLHQMVQHQPLLYAKENVYLAGQPPPPAPPGSVYKADFKKPYHHLHFHQNCHDLDPQAATPLNGANSECDGVYETTNTPQPYELRYDDESDFSDSYDEHGGAGRIQHYPSLYSCTR